MHYGHDNIRPVTSVMHYGRDKIITDVTEISALIGQLDPINIFKLPTPLLRCNMEIKPVLMVQVPSKSEKLYFIENYPYIGLNVTEKHTHLLAGQSMCWDNDEKEHAALPKPTPTNKQTWKGEAKHVL